MIEDRQIIAGRRIELPNRLACLAPRKYQRGFRIGYGIRAECIENRLRLRRRDCRIAKEFERLLGHHGIGIFFAQLLEFGDGVGIALDRVIGRRAPVDRVIADQRIVRRLFKPRLRFAVIPFRIIEVAKSESRALPEFARAAAQSKSTEAGISSSGIFVA